MGSQISAPSTPIQVQQDRQEIFYPADKQIQTPNRRTFQQQSTLTKEQKMSILIQQKINDADSSLNTTQKQNTYKFPKKIIQQQFQDRPNVELPQQKGKQKPQIQAEKQQIQPEKIVIKVPNQSLIGQQRNDFTKGPVKVNYVLEELKKFNEISKIDIYGDQRLQYADLDNQNQFQNANFNLESQQVERERMRVRRDE